MYAIAAISGDIIFSFEVLGAYNYSPANIRYSVIMSKCSMPMESTKPREESRSSLRGKWVPCTEDISGGKHRKANYKRSAVLSSLLNLLFSL